MVVILSLVMLVIDQPALAYKNGTDELRGDLATGWSVGWKVNVWIHLHDDDDALTLLTNLFKLITTGKMHISGGGTYPNALFRFVDAGKPLIKDKIKLEKSLIYRIFLST